MKIAADITANYSDARHRGIFRARPMFAAA